MKSETRQALSDYFKAVGVSEMPRRKKKKYKKEVTRIAKIYEEFQMAMGREGFPLQYFYSPPREGCIVGCHGTDKSFKLFFNGNLAHK